MNNLKENWPYYLGIIGLTLGTLIFIFSQT